MLWCRLTSPPPFYLGEVITVIIPLVEYNPLGITSVKNIKIEGTPDLHSEKAGKKHRICKTYVGRSSIQNKRPTAQGTFCLNKRPVWPCLMYWFKLILQAETRTHHGKFRDSCCCIWINNRWRSVYGLFCLVEISSSIVWLQNKMKMVV